jgi:eukaryotic-like serine/threonine-protein kinase
MSAWTVCGYTEERELGRGASGRVVLATHDATGLPVAVKYLDENLAGDGDFLRGFRAEARLLAEIDNPHLVRLYEYVETGAAAAIVMELVNGVTLRAILRQGGPAEPEAALVVLKGSLLGLAAAHAHGVVHGDYKPENVLVGSDGATKLADFGIATRVSRETEVAGTAGYLAPERWSGAAGTPQSDIYAATATFFECITGHPPFAAPGDVAVLRRQHEQAPVPAEDVPPPLRDLIRQGLSKDPRQRPADAAAFLEALEVAASSGYGPGWESSGRDKLARRAAVLALLFPLGTGPAGGTAVGGAQLGSGRLRAALLTSAVAIVVVGAGVTGYTALTPTGATHALATPSLVTTVTPGVTPVVEAPTPSATPTASPSAKPVAPPKLTVTLDNQPVLDCPAGQYPDLILRNTGGKTLTWSAAGPAGPPLIMIQPASGTLAPGHYTNVQVSGTHPPPVAITVTSNGGNKTVTYACA